MKTILIALFGTFITLAVVQADEEKTYEGTMACEKCSLKTGDKCADTLKVGDVVYLMEENGKRKTSEHVCSDTEEAKVTGKIVERDGKKFLVASKIEIK